MNSQANEVCQGKPVIETLESVFKDISDQIDGLQNVAIDINGIVNGVFPNSPEEKTVAFQPGIVGDAKKFRTDLNKLYESLSGIRTSLA